MGKQAGVGYSTYRFTRQSTIFEVFDVNQEIDRRRK